MIVILMLTAGFMGLMNDTIVEADGLVITGPTTWTSDQTYHEDVTIQAGGSLTINPGVNVYMGSGDKIIVDDGTLIIKGEWNKRVRFSLASAPDLWGGIEARKDANVIIDKAEIRFARTGVMVLGAGHSGTSKSISVTNTSFVTCDNGVVMDGNGEIGPFKCTFRDNNIGNSDYSISLRNFYDGVTIENNYIYSCFDYGIRIYESKNVKVLNNTISDSRFGITPGFIDSGITLIENNTIRDTKVGLNGGFLIGGHTAIRNNSFFCSEKGIWMGIMNRTLIENNTVTVMGYYAKYPIEVASGSPPTVIKDNILSACKRTMMINGTAEDHIIYDNLLLNLTDSAFVDSDGDGYCDTDPLIPGSANTYAKKCRTSVYHLGNPTTTYVNPAQAAEHAPAGSKLMMISNPSGYGPKELENRQIYHTKMPIITKPMHLIGEEKEMLVFYPGECMDSPRIENTDNAGITNVTVEDGIYAAKVENSHNITLKGFNVWAYDDPYFNGFDIDGGIDVLIEDCYLQKNWEYGLNITDSTRVQMRDSSIVSSEDLGIYIENSRGISLENTTSRLGDTNAMIAKDSVVHWKDSDIQSLDDGIVMVNCPGSTLSKLEVHTVNTNDYGIRLTDSPMVSITDCKISMGYHNVDYTGIMLRGNSAGCVIHHCQFVGNPGNPNDINPVNFTGEFSDVSISACTFQIATVGISIFEPTLISEIKDVAVRECTFNMVREPIRSIFNGELLVDACQITDGDFGIYSLGTELKVNGTDISDISDIGIYSTHEGGVSSDLYVTNSTVSNATKGVTHRSLSTSDTNTIIDGLTVEGAKVGLFSEFNTANVRDSSIGGTQTCILFTGTDRSIVMRTILSGDVPITLYKSTESRNSVLLANCTGNHEESVIGDSNCMATWMWSLDVNIYDEKGMLLPSRLIIDSSTSGEVVNKTTNGREKIDLVGYYKDYSGGTDVSDYSVKAVDGEYEVTEDVEMLGWRELSLVINHEPVVSGSAPSNITFDEDTAWSSDISEWFRDMDQLTYSVEDLSPVELDYDLTGDVLEVSAEEDWYGNGSIRLKAVDTYDEEVSHTLEVNVLPVNDPPHLTKEIPELNTEEDTPVWINLSEYGADIDTVMLIWSDQTAENCTLIWNSANLTITPSPDWYGSTNITLFLSDGFLDVKANLTLNVVSVNDPPVWNGEPIIFVNVKAGETQTLTISDMVSDVDNTWEELEVTFDSDRASIRDGVVEIQYPADTESMNDMITVTISDGSANTSFRINVTVEEAEEEWRIDDAEVTIDEETGDWTVVVEAPEDQDIYVVVEGAGSYKLTETEPGHYEVVIPGENFQGGKSYDYHFSDTDGGDDMTGGEFSGSEKQPDTDDEKDDFPIWIVILVLLAIAIILAFILISRRRSAEIYEE